MERFYGVSCIPRRWVPAFSPHPEPKTYSVNVVERAKEVCADIVAIRNLRPNNGSNTVYSKDELSLKLEDSCIILRERENTFILDKCSAVHLYDMVADGELQVELYSLRVPLLWGSDCFLQIFMTSTEVVMKYHDDYMSAISRQTKKNVAHTCPILLVNENSN